MADEPDRTLVRGPLREAAVDGPCPYCGLPALVMRSLPLEIPYFGDALQTTVSCGSCSYRRADLLLTERGEPVRHALRVERSDDLNARVVRSTSGTIRVPELGVVIEPGPRAEAFVTNAEGVLRRLRDILEFARRNADSDAARRHAERAIADVDQMIAGSRAFTLIVEDPTGNSAIIHDRATKKKLSAGEARRLKRGTPDFSLSR